MSDRQRSCAWLRDRDGFSDSHPQVRPDGDTIGCAAALCLALRGRGKTRLGAAQPGGHQPLHPLSGGADRPRRAASPDTVVSVDIAARGLFTGERPVVWLERGVDLAIDHHPSQEFFARETCLDAGRAACGELIYDIVGPAGPGHPGDGRAPLRGGVHRHRLLRLRQHHRRTPTGRRPP